MGYKKNIFIFLLLFATPLFLVSAQSGEAPTSTDPIPVPAESSAATTSLADTPQSASTSAASSSTSAPVTPVRTPISSTPVNPIPRSTTSNPTGAIVSSSTATSSSDVSSSSAVTANGSGATSGGSRTAMLVVVGSLVLLALGITAAIERTKKKEGVTQEKNSDRCSALKKTLEQKKTELVGVENNFSLQETLVERLKNKIAEKVEEAKDKIKEGIKEMVKDKVFKDEDEGMMRKALRYTEAGKEKYDDVREKYEQAQKLLELLQTKKELLQAEIKRLEASYRACRGGSAVSLVTKKESAPILPEVSFGESEKLFVDKTIEIDAKVADVWDVLTKRAHTDTWALEFSSGGPEFHIESDWKLGSPVLWKSKSGRVIVEGNVTALKPGRLLRFTVFDVRGERPKVSNEDGITYEFREKNGKTKLHILQGDFSTMEEGEKYRDASAEVWERVLPRVKEIAEYIKK